MFKLLIVVFYLNFPPQPGVDIRPAEKVPEVVVTLGAELPELLLGQGPRPDIQPRNPPVEGLGGAEPSSRLVLLLSDDEEAAFLDSAPL